MTLSERDRIAIWVVAVSDLAGVARHVLDVASVGVPGWDLIYLMPEGPLATRLRAEGHEVRTLGFGQRHPLRSVALLRWLINDSSPALVHSHLAWADVIAAAARPPGCQLVTTEHGIAVGHLYQRTPWKALSRRAIHRLRMQRTDAAIAVSAATAHVAEERWGLPRGGKVNVIPNGVDPLVEDPRQTGPGTRFGCLARLAPEKDFVTMLKAFELLLAELPDATLQIAGRGPLERWMTREIERRGLGHVVTMRGFMEPAAFFEDVDVVVQLSRWENCSYSVLDSVVRGKGVVATAVGGYLEYLPDSCLVPVGDPDAAARRMLEQATNPDVRPVLPQDWPSVSEMTRRIARVYESVVDAPVPAPDCQLVAAQAEV